MGTGAALLGGAPGLAATVAPLCAASRFPGRSARVRRRRAARQRPRRRSTSFDCEVEGKLPADLDGVFYRVGPDPQYPKPAKYAGDILFDGEGHVAMFRIKNGHVDYRTRYAEEPAVEGAARGAPLAVRDVPQPADRRSRASRA